MKNKKILITGGAGFIGSHTAKALSNNGHKIVIVDNLSTGLKSNLPNKAKFYKLNITSKKIEQIFDKEKPEVVYHFASNVLVPKSTENPLLEMDSLEGGINVFHQAMKHKVKKVIFSSSGFIYGNNPNFPLKETASFQPISPYAIIKYTLENYLIFYRKEFGLNSVILRYATVYGPGQSLGAMADYIRKLKEGKQAEIYGDGTKTRDYIYIDDVAAANLKALNLGDSYKDPVFNIGTGKQTSLNKIYKEVARILDKKAKPVYMPTRPGELEKYSLDVSKAKRVLHWKPVVSIKEGLLRKIKEES